MFHVGGRDVLAHKEDGENRIIHPRDNQILPLSMSDSREETHIATRGGLLSPEGHQGAYRLVHGVNETGRIVRDYPTRICHGTQKVVPAL